jgi:hypothetical protein
MYIKYYSLMGSTVVMVLVPVIILITACISMHKAIPAGNQKQRTLRIMTVIILMFTVCHVPKVKAQVHVYALSQRFSNEGPRPFLGSRSPSFKIR